MFHNKYDHTKSSTYVANGTKFIAHESKFNLTGYYSNDTISVSLINFNYLKVLITFLDRPFTGVWSIICRNDRSAGYLHFY